MFLDPDEPDYSRPCVDVERRVEVEWPWGVTHTVRPDTLSPMAPGVASSVTVKVQRMVAVADADPALAGLYARAAAIAGVRIRDLAPADDSLHHWVMCHAWRTVPTGSGALVFAMVMMGVLRPIAGQPRPAGERPPTTRDLMTSGGATMEALRDTSPQRAAEVFVEFDHRLSATGAAPPFLYSYGERVPRATLDTFEPFVRRAESHARAHQARFDVPGPAAAPFAIGHRQWYLADNLVTVELQLRPEPPAG